MERLSALAVRPVMLPAAAYFKSFRPQMDAPAAQGERI